jgi:hypothetical protein
MDYNPSDSIITEGSQFIRAKQGSRIPCCRPVNDCFEKYIKDSVYLYIAYLDSIIVTEGPYSLIKVSDINDNFLIARMTLREEEFFDPTHDSPMKTVFFPPRNKATTIFYY